MYCDPEKYMETRYMIQKAMERAVNIIQEAAHDFEHVFGRMCCGLMEEYYSDDARIVVLGMGSMMSVVKEVVDELRARGEKVGALKLITYRPFPGEQLYHALSRAEEIVVVEKALSLGGMAPLASELRSLFYHRPSRPRISSFVAGLGGRDITRETIGKALEISRSGAAEGHFLDLRADLELEGVS